MEESEEWRRVADFPDYSVSSFGRVRRDTNGKGPAKAGRMLALTPNSNGYPVVILCCDGRKRWVSVPVLACETFIGPRPTPKHKAAHWDGDPLNNRLGNLRWATNKENMADCIRHGRTLRGSKQSLVKLTEEQVRSARYRMSAGETQQSIADDLGVSQVAISCIKTGRTWYWLE